MYDGKSKLKLLYIYIYNSSDCHDYWPPNTLKLSEKESLLSVKVEKSMSLVATWILTQFVVG